MNKNAIVVNLIAPPSSGKSTIAAGVFAKLKWMGADCELVSEFAKELVWEERHETFKDELYIFAKQNHRLFRVNGKVDVVVTDRPIILSAFYNHKYGDDSAVFEDMVLHTHDKYNNLNFFIERAKPYNPNGRNQTEEESDQFGVEMKEMLDSFGIEYYMLKGTPDAVDVIADEIWERVEEWYAPVQNWR